MHYHNTLHKNMKEQGLPRFVSLAYDYFYNNYGLIEKISSYDIDNDLEVKKLDLLYSK